MHKIVVILRKEWIELRQQPILIFTSILLPLLFSVGPVVVALLIRLTSPSDLLKPGTDINQLSNGNPALAGMEPREVLQALIGVQVNVFFLLLPVILPNVIASYSVVGEKTSRTLEPVLATPVTTLQLLSAKCLTSLIPSVVLSWAAGAIFATGMSLVAVSNRVVGAILSPTWFVMMLLWVPFVSLISIGITVAISARANDPRSAQQISAVLILPIIALFVGQLSGLLVLSPFFVLLATLLLGLLAAGALWLAVALFQRETILTRWS